MYKRGKVTFTKNLFYFLFKAGDRTEGTGHEKHLFCHRVTTSAPSSKSLRPRPFISCFWKMTQKKHSQSSWQSRARQCTPITPAFGSLRQRDCKLEVSLGNKVTSRPASNTQQDHVSKNQTKQNINGSPIYSRVFQKAPNQTIYCDFGQTHLIPLHHKTPSHFNKWGLSVHSNMPQVSF